MTTWKNEKGHETEVGHGEEQSERSPVGRVVIKPCPFCGSEAELQGPHEYSNGGTFWRVECQTCWATRSEWPTDEVAKATWNERAL